MANATVVVEQVKSKTYSHTIKHESKSERADPAENRKLRAFGQRVYTEMINTMKTLLLLGAVLAAYEVTGLHAWWTQFIGRLF